MVRKSKVAVTQVCSKGDVGVNLDTCRRLVAEAAQAGAEVVGLPENFAFIGADDVLLELGESFEDPGPILQACSQMAHTNEVHLIVGGFPERSAVPTHVYNTCFHCLPDGNIAERYRKIHLFDVNLADGTCFSESSRTAAGSDLVTTQLPFGTLGLSICYDLRFPLLYQGLVDAGAIALAIPAAFTLTTGRAHWHTLLRARAIECQSYVIAPAQYGKHNFGNRHSFGHALIYDPWGELAAECTAEEPSFAVAEIDPELINRVRSQLPSLEHRRRLQ
ncbi:MAG: carbon-nitrogen hydrolase family protein [Gammaproteobacteria bacterium]|nr:carbon-nitrogen hydrolase family protein [Gammaproteobacteria bacterium]